MTADADGPSRAADASTPSSAAEASSGPSRTSQRLPFELRKDIVRVWLTALQQAMKPDNTQLLYPEGNSDRHDVDKRRKRALECYHEALYEITITISLWRVPPSGLWWRELSEVPHGYAVRPPPADAAAKRLTYGMMPASSSALMAPG